MRKHDRLTNNFTIARNGGAGLIEILIALLLASGCLVPLLRAHLMSTIHFEEQRRLTLASLAANDWHERLLLIDAKTGATACTESCEAEFRAWQAQWQSAAADLRIALGTESGRWRIEIAWPAHPLLGVNGDCELDSACIHIQEPV